MGGNKTMCVKCLEPLKVLHESYVLLLLHQPCTVRSFSKQFKHLSLSAALKLSVGFTAPVQTKLSRRAQLRIAKGGALF